MKESGNIMKIFAIICFIYAVISTILHLAAGLYAAATGDANGGDALAIGISLSRSLLIILSALIIFRG